MAGFIYNKDVFDEPGPAGPATWDGFCVMAFRWQCTACLRRQPDR